MDYGLRLTTPARSRADPRDACPPDGATCFPPGRAVALYFGTEFCEDRLPDLDDANAYCAVARDHGLEPTLTTPLVSPEGLSKVDRLLEGLASNGWRPAVVFNDWGVLELLRERHRALPRRAGRLSTGRCATRARTAMRLPAPPRTTRRASRGCARSSAASASRRSKPMRTSRADSSATATTAAKRRSTARSTSRSPTPRRAAAARSRPRCIPKAAASRRRSPIPAPHRAAASPCPSAARDTAAAALARGNTLFYEPPHEATRAWLPHADRIVVHAMAAP